MHCGGSIGKIKRDGTKKPERVDNWDVKPKPDVKSGVTLNTVETT